MIDGKVFDGALCGDLHWLHLDDDGGPQRLSVTRWHGAPDPGDELMLGRCQGATLDIGCGPGRLTGALTTRGVIVLGVDISARAVQLTVRRGGVALRRDVFDPLPGQGSWDHALLADGNIGIGGDPRRLLRRVRQLLGRASSVIIEVEPPGIGVRSGIARIGAGPRFPWSRVGADAVQALGAAVGFRLIWMANREQRWFAELALA
ncbi:MAG: methyltransferase domain-containing protein [Pseudonocardiaceae bacterium]